MANEAARFDGDWLALREPADHAARSARLADQLAEWLQDSDGLRVIDLGAGAGSNLRWLAPRLAADQDWLLIDHDDTLLAIARQGPVVENAAGLAVRISTHCVDLAGLPRELFDDADLITATAMFDLVSVDWIEGLARRIAGCGVAGLFALTVDGRRWFVDEDGRRLEDKCDARLAELFNRHQRRGKGMGEALGPAAADILPAKLEKAGLRVWTDRADWRLAAGLEPTLTLGTALLEDWLRAAVEQSPADAAWIKAWYRTRRAELESGRIGLVVGHVDVLALPQAQ